LLAARQLADYLTEEMPGSGGARDPVVVVRREIVAFQAWMVETRSASTGLNKHKSLQQFFRWLVEEGEIDRSPMAGVPQPRTKQKLVQILTDEQTPPGR
jgi:site-specific recombinase XerD